MRILLRYLAALIPATICVPVGLWFAYGDPAPVVIVNNESHDMRHLAYGWYAIGLVMSGVGLIGCIIWDIGEWWRRRDERIALLRELESDRSNPTNTRPPVR